MAQYEMHTFTRAFQSQFLRFSRILQQPVPLYRI